MNTTDEDRAYLERYSKVFILSFLIGIAFSYPLWLPIRILPTAPIIGLFDNHLLVCLFFAVFCLGAFVVFKSSSPSGYLVLLSSVLLLVLGDQIRLQPWVYLYSAVALALSFSSRRPQRTYQMLLLILFFTYFWSGIHKLNRAFYSETLTFLLTPVRENIPVLFTPLLLFSLSAPFLEAGAAVGLLFEKTRRYAAIALIIMHLFILSLIGPHALDWNRVVWPWNLFMIYSLYLLVLRRSASLSLFQGIRSSKLLLCFIFCYGVLPFLGLFGYWDLYLSHALYSGRGPRAYFFDEGGKTEGKRFLHWALSDLGVAGYPAERVYRSVFRTLCVRNSKTELLIESSPGFFSLERQQIRYRCSDKMN